MNEFVDRWEQLKKALSHAAAVRRVAPTPQPKDDGPVEAHPDILPKVEYGHKAVSGGMNSPNIGFAKVGGRPVVVRHGSAAQRTDVEHQMSKLLGADHMVPDQDYDHGINHPDHHGEETYDPHEHGGTSIQDHVDGKDGFDAMDDDELVKKLRDQWKNGDLHKLWALHYISNNGDMHSNNYKVNKDGVKAFDSGYAFHELPHAHSVSRDDKGNVKLEYNPYSFDQLPSYLSPFINHEGQDDSIEPKYAKDQVAVKQLNEHAAKIDPKLFEQFGPHAAERAAKAKKALMSSDPTSEMVKLWKDHKDHTGDLTWDKNKAKQAA